MWPKLQLKSQKNIMIQQRFPFCQKLSTSHTVLKSIQENRKTHRTSHNQGLKCMTNPIKYKWHQFLYQYNFKEHLSSAQVQQENFLWSTVTYWSHPLENPTTEGKIAFRRQRNSLLLTRWCICQTHDIWDLFCTLKNKVSNMQLDQCRVRHYEMDKLPQWNNQWFQ